MSTKKICIVAGETSGDKYGAKLIEQLRNKNKAIEFFGMGGTFMRNQGADIIIDNKELAIIGTNGSLQQLLAIFKSYALLKKALCEKHPDLLILIDYPEFNLRLAKFANKLGIKIVYYVSPQIWAWRTSRIKIIKKYVDVMAVILPFEVDFYKKFGVKVTFVGHPLLEEVKPTMAVNVLKADLGLDETKIVIGIMPGSRLGEIKKLLDPMLKAAEIIKRAIANIEFVLPLSPSLNESDLADYLRSSPIKVHITKNIPYDTMQICDAIMVCSGTASLEIGLMAKPFVLIYKLSALNYYLAKLLIKIKFIGLCNIIAGKKITTELIQNEATPENIAREIIKIIQDNKYRIKMIQELQEMRKLLLKQKEKNIEDLVLENLN